MEIIIKLNDDDIAKGFDLDAFIAKKEPKTAKKETEKEKQPQSENLVTKADVRAKALEITKAGKAAELSAVFNSFGVSKLSELKEEDYADCLKKLQEV